MRCIKSFCQHFHRLKSIRCENADEIQSGGQGGKKNLYSISGVFGCPSQGDFSSGYVFQLYICYSFLNTGNPAEVSRRIWINGNQ